MDQLRTTRHEQGGWTVIGVTGPVDVVTAPQLRQTLIKEQLGGRSVALDLDAVEFIDSFGLGVLVGAVKRAATRSGELIVVCSRSRLRELFQITGLDRVLRVVESPAQLGEPGPASGAQ